MKHLGWSCVLLALCACPPKPKGDCGNFTCTETERCESSTLLCLPDEPPQISVIAPSTVVSTPTFALSGIITDDESVTAAEWQTGSAAAVPLTLDAEGAFTIMVDAPMLDSQSTVITLRARDRRTQTTKDVSVQIDRVPPTLTLVRPDAGTLVGMASVEVAASATDGSGSLSELLIDGQAISMPRSGVEATKTIAVPETHNGDPIGFVVTAADPHGNRATQTFSLVGDRVGPAMSIVSPAANALIATASFNVAIDTADPSSISSVSVEFGTNTYAATEESAGYWTVSVLTGVEEQDRVITITVTDGAGNRTTQTRMVRIDRVAPTVSVASPAAGSLQAGSFTATVTTSTGTDSVEAVFEGDMVTLAGGPTLWTGTLAPPQNRDFSSATLTVTARDLAGNSATAEVMMNVDNVAPVIAFTAPTANQCFNASAFTASPNVTVTWTVTDADTQAATTTVNGSASTALMTSVATTANDNPAMYSTTVVAADRAGNSATSTVNWSADRQAPTLVTWTPSNNTRNVEPWQSTITFSERVSGPLDTSPALLLTGLPAPTNDSWNPAHTTYTLPLDTFKTFALEVTPASNLADDCGNPLVGGAPRRFHMATGFPTATTVIATGVSQFDGASDEDGVVSVAVLTTGNVLKLFEDTGGQFAERTVTQPSPPPTAVWLNVSNVFNTTTLYSTRRLGLTAFSFPQWWRYQFVNGSEEPGSPSTAAQGAVVGRLPVPNEPTAASFGMIDGSTYSRGSLVRTLSNRVSGVVAHSNDSWAAHTLSSTQVLWSHYRCRALLNGGFQCGSIGYGANATSPTSLQAAMTPNGTCLATTWTSGTTRQGVFQTLTPCEPAGVCVDSTLGLTPWIPANLRVAPFGANNENTLLFSYASGLDLMVAKMTQSCGVGSVPVGTIPIPAAHQPVRVGNRPGVLHLIGTTLRLRVF